MRCVYSLCQSTNTRRLEKTLKLHYEGDKIVDAHITELWLCNNCGNPFIPGTRKIERWHTPFQRAKGIPKKHIIEELFR